jgi:hypothetical protein
MSSLRPGKAGASWSILPDLSLMHDMWGNHALGKEKYSNPKEYSYIFGPCSTAFAVPAGHALGHELLEILADS